MKMVVIYDRIPEVPFLALPKKGKPHLALLYPYSKNYGFKEFGLDTKPSTRGGATTVCLVDNDSNWAITGRTVCSMSDNFSYKEGRERALLRATNLGLGHDDLDSGLMFYMGKLDKYVSDNGKNISQSAANVWITSYAAEHYNRLGIDANTLYFHPETAKIMPEFERFKVKTSKIILKNHVWIGFEE